MGPYVHSDGFHEERWLNWSDTYNSRNVYLPIDKHHPLLGHTLMENLSDRPVYHWKVSSNSKGMRGTTEYPVERTNKPRIVAIGDSFTFGECVNDDESFPAYLEKKGNLEVLNMAVHAYGHDQMLLRLKLEGLQYNPDIVLLGFYQGDIARNQLTFFDYLKPKFVLKNNELILTNVPVPSPEVYREQFRARTFNYIQMLLDKLIVNRLRFKENRKVSKKILEEIHKEIKAINATFVSVYIPRFDIIMNNTINQSDAFHQFCENEQILCINPTARLHEFIKDKEDPGWYFRCHYDKEINKLIADEIYAVLESKGMLSKSDNIFKG